LLRIGGARADGRTDDNAREECVVPAAQPARNTLQKLRYNNNQRRNMKEYNFSDLANSAEIEEKAVEFDQIVGRLLQCMIVKQVAENLDRYFKEISMNFEKMTSFEQKEAKLVILEMMKVACNEFHIKNKSGIEMKTQLALPAEGGLTALI
jgi:hypothetical protein